MAYLSKSAIGFLRYIARLVRRNPAAERNHFCNTNAARFANLFGWPKFGNTTIKVQQYLKPAVVNPPQICTLGGIERGQKYSLLDRATSPLQACVSEPDFPECLFPK
jgi:hypothetical protein